MDKLTDTATGTSAESARRSPLTASATLHLAAVIRAAHAGAKVGRLMPDGDPLAGQMLVGIARHVVADENGAFPGRHDDVRDCYLRVTGTLMEYFWPLADLAAEHETGSFTTTIAD